MAIYKKIIDKQLYVYMNGKLLYKRWLERGYGKVFCDTWGSTNF